MQYIHQYDLTKEVVVDKILSFLYSISNEIKRTNMMNKVHIGMTLTIYKVVSKNSIKRGNRSIDAATNQNAGIDQMI